MGLDGELRSPVAGVNVSRMEGVGFGAYGLPYADMLAEGTVGYVVLAEEVMGFDMPEGIMG